MFVLRIFYTKGPNKVENTSVGQCRAPEREETKQSNAVIPYYIISDWSGIVFPNCKASLF